MLFGFCVCVCVFVGDPALLHIQIRDFNVDMQSLEKLSCQELKALCEKCDIPVTSQKSQVTLTIFQVRLMFPFSVPCDHSMQQYKEC